MGEIHELFVLALSLVWFAGATPEFFPVLSPSLAADNHGAWVGIINCLAARNLVLNFPLFL